MLSDSDAVLDWAVTHQSDPFPYPYSTGPQWIRRPREALAKGPLSTTPRAAVDIEGVDLVDEELPLGEMFLRPRWVCSQGFALGPSKR